MKYNEIERLQQLAGIITEIKINNPNITSEDLYSFWKYIDDREYIEGDEANNLIYSYAEKYNFPPVFNYKDLFNKLTKEDVIKLYNELKKFK